MARKPKKKVKKEDNNVGVLYPVGMGGPGVDWTKINEGLKKKHES